MDSELRSTLISTDAQGNETVISGIQEGNRLPSVPRVQAAAAVTFRRPLRQGAQAFLTGTYHHVGSRFTMIDDYGTATCAPDQSSCPFGTVDMENFEARGGATIGGPLTQRFFTFDPELPAYNLVNLRLGVTRADWEAALFVNNLTDERALLALDRERGSLARVGYLTNQPRTVGVTLGFNY
jgi:iron complex outermembrane receptor protein